MTTKILLLVFLGIIHYAASAGQLRRTPKVYNALITTDDNLVPSRSFPVIQPTIHETGIASYPFNVFSSPYRVYNPLIRFAPPYPQAFPQPNFQPQNFPPVPDQVGSRPNELGPPQQQQPPQNPHQPLLPTPLPPQQGMPPQDNQQQPPPFPVNQFGLPPSLYPLNQFPNQQNPVYLPPFSHPNYPMIPEGFPGSPQRYPESYLPPYEYLPPGFPFGFRPPPSNKPPPKKYPGNPNKESAESSPEKIELSLEDDEDEVTTQIPLKNIKNNKNSKVPDVPPPPIPGKHKKQSQKQS